METGRVRPEQPYLHAVAQSAQHPAQDPMATRDLTKVMDLLLDAVCVVDSAGLFISISGACERIFGYRPEEMIGKAMIDFVHPEDRASTLRAATKVMKGHLQHDFENRYLHKDGRTVYIMWSARWSEDDQVRVAVARDITERKTAEHAQADASAGGGAVPTWRLSESPPCLIPPSFPPIPLSPQDYKVLLALATGGRCVSRQEIVGALGKSFLDYDQRRLDTQMRRLRRKVETACGLQLPVTTLRSEGYRFYEDIEVCRRVIHR